MKHRILQLFIHVGTLTLAMNPHQTMGQTLVTTGKADNNIVYPGAVIGFNATDALITFNLTGARDCPKKPATGLVYSLQAAAKPEDGIGAVFSGGDLTPDGTGKIAFGYRWSNANYPAYYRVEQLGKALNAADAAFNKTLIDELTKRLGTLAVPVSSVEQLVIDSKLVVKLTSDPGLFNANVDALAAETAIKGNAPLVALLALYKTDMQAGFKAHTEAREKLRLQIRNETRIANSKNPVRHRFLIYLDGSLRAMSFKRPGPIDTTSFAKGFYDEEYQGGEGRIGFNWNIGGRLLAGLSVGVGKAENKATLTKTEYTIRTTQTNQTQQLISEQKVTAFAGDFKTYTRTSINLDLVWIAWVSDSTVLAVDPYLRHSISSAQDVMPDHTDIGLSFNFYKARTGAFSGSLYIESSDVGNAIARSTAERTNDVNAIEGLDPFYKRLTFGLTVKMSLSSIAKLGG